MKTYIQPIIDVVQIKDIDIICTSNQKNPNIIRNDSSQPPSVHKVYSSMSFRQKVAAMNLMTFFGGSCSGNPQEINKINHIMTVSGREMGISEDEVHAGWSNFSGMEDMVNAIKDVDRSALERLFWSYFCIVGVGKSPEAVQMLLGVYRKLGFTEEECISILEKISGKKLSDI